MSTHTNPEACEGLKNHQQRKEDTKCGEFLPYILASYNLLKGSWPCPAWVYAQDCGFKEKLGKSLRKQYSIIQKMQEENEKKITKLAERRKFTSISSSDSMLSSQQYANGLWEIQQLYNNVPRLMPIKADETSHLEVSDSGASCMCLRFKTLALEIETQKKSKRVMMSTPTPRWLHHSIILLPPPSNKVLHDDLVITPLAKEAQEVSLILPEFAAWHQ